MAPDRHRLIAHVVDGHKGPGRLTDLNLFCLHFQRYGKCIAVRGCLRGLAGCNDAAEEDCKDEGDAPPSIERSTHGSNLSGYPPILRRNLRLLDEMSGLSATRTSRETGF